MWKSSDFFSFFSHISRSVLDPVIESKANLLKNSFLQPWKDPPPEISILQESPQVSQKK